MYQLREKAVDSKKTGQTINTSLEKEPSNSANVSLKRHSSMQFSKVSPTDI